MGASIGAAYAFFRGPLAMLSSSLLLGVPFTVMGLFSAYYVHAVDHENATMLTRFKQHVKSVLQCDLLVEIGYLKPFFNFHCVLFQRYHQQN